jgi:putative NADH-flavin reductase
MKIIVFGSTGTIGKHLIEQALDEDHEVTAFARDITKITFHHENLVKVEGDVMKRESVNAAILHHDAVLVVLGAGRKGVVRSAGTLNIINAMKDHGIKRLICQSSLGVGDSRNNLNFFWKYIMFGMLLRPAYADHELQEQYVRNSELEWTIVRPSAFTDGQRTGKYRHGFSVFDNNTTLKISRADVAEFLLKQLSDLRYLHKSPGLSY